jgi:tetratricopeptide (TPR) repeat protein
MLLQPWVSRADASGATLRVQADILQNRHDFSGAIRLLDAAIQREPRDAGARLMRASVKVVQGHSADARADCAAVLASGATAAGTVCLAQMFSVTGKLAQAETLLKTVLPRESASPQQVSYSPVAVPQTFSTQILGWAFWLQADCADRRGDFRAAEQYLRASLAATPTNEGVRAALSDLLIARGALHEAIAVVDLPAPSTGLLERRARAQQLLGDSGLSATRAQIDDLLSLASRRGERPHLREEALLALDVDGNAERALELARANFEVQRETIDARLLVRAARAHGDRDAIETVAKWMRETGFEDRVLADIHT